MINQTMIPAPTTAPTEIPMTAAVEGPDPELEVLTL